MSVPEPPFDPESPVPLGDLKRFTRRRTSLRRYLLPMLAGATITLVFVLLISWIVAMVANRLG